MLTLKKMRNILFIILLTLTLGCKTKSTNTAKFDTTKLLLSEEILMDSTNNKSDTFAKINYNYDSLKRVISVIDNDYEIRSVKSTKSTYDGDNNLIKQEILDSGKTKILEYHYKNGIPSYSIYTGASQHYEDFTVINNKIVKRFLPQRNTTLTAVYEENNLTKETMSSTKFILSNTYTYGKRRSPNYGRCYKWQGLADNNSENETLQNKILDFKNKYCYEDYTYTYNEYGYPTKQVCMYHDADGNSLGDIYITYFRYFPAK